MSAEHTTISLKTTRGSFVRGLPLSMPIEEVIERGREAGLELQPSDIHSTRYYMRQAAAAEAARKSSVTQQLQLGPGFIGQAAKDAGATHASGDEDDEPASKPVDRSTGTRNKRAPKHASLATVGTMAKVAKMPKMPKMPTMATVAKMAAMPPMPSASGAALDHQLRVLVLRLGTDRTRAVVAELEALADRIARER